MDWRDQLDRKNPVTTRIRVAAIACDETEVAIRVLKMLHTKKSPKDTSEMMMAFLCVKEGPMGVRIERLPSTPATTTSEITNRRTAWLRAPMMERSVKPAIFRRR